MELLSHAPYCVHMDMVLEEIVAITFLGEAKLNLEEARAP